MGSSPARLHFPEKCFNGQNNWHLGWYRDRALELDASQDLKEPLLLDIVAFVDYEKAKAGMYAIVKIENFYLQYNRAKSFNRDTNEKRNSLAVVEDIPGVGTNLIDGLSEFKPLLQQGIGKNILTIEVCDSTKAFDDSFPDILHVSVGRNGWSACPHSLSTRPPTSEPVSHHPSLNPTHVPTSYPVNSPTFSPVTAPTRSPTVSPTTFIEPSAPSSSDPNENSNDPPNFSESNDSPKEKMVSRDAMDMKIILLVLAFVALCFGALLYSCRRKQCLAGFDIHIQDRDEDRAYADAQSIEVSICDESYDTSSLSAANACLMMTDESESQPDTRSEAFQKDFPRRASSVSTLTETLADFAGDLDLDSMESDGS